jgi:hypothetical protein
LSQSSEPKENKKKPAKPTAELPIDGRSAKAILWKKGILNSWKLDENQKTIYNFFKSNDKKITVLACSRQMGKSFMLCTMALEECLSAPNRVVKIIAPEVKMVKTILRPIMRELLMDCPEDLQPKLRPNEHIYRFANGSEIQMAGTDNGNAENIRGTKAHLCIVDEAGFCSDLDYIVKSILLPTTTTTKGRIILSSTPAKTNDHEFIKFWQKAELDSAFIKRTIFDNPRLTKEDIDQLAEAMGGYDSVGFRREYLCELITSEEDAVIPEFNNKTEADIVREWPRPPYYDAYASMDIGFKDLTVILFAYYDFKNGKLVIEDELVVNGKRLLTDQLAEDIQKTEDRLWINPMTGESKTPYLRVSDNNNLILLNDLQSKHGLTFLPIQKDNTDAAINNMRMMIKQRKIIINPRCRTLIFHLKNAIWNKSRTSFVRSQDSGHYDAIDSLKYLCRGFQPGKNPYPDNYQGSKTDDIFFEKQKNTSDLAKQFQKMFTIKRNK